MKNLILVFALFTFVSCAHHHDCKESCELDQKDGHMFGKKCAYSLAEGDGHVKGKEDFKLKHASETYYFSSKEKLEKFKLNLKQNLKSAKSNWIKSEQR
jgi:YHS domain-containing protein